MKKDLRHIFDRASASELENLIDQNKAPEISSDTLDSIQSKVYAKTRISKVKTQKPLVFRWQSYVATAAACFCLVVGIMFGTGIFPMMVAQAEEVDEKTEQGMPNMQELPEGFEYVVFLTENNHLILQTKDEVIMDVDFEYVWSEDDEYSYIAVYYGRMLHNGALFATKKYAQKLLNQYLTFQIPLKKVVSGDEREHMIIGDDLPPNSLSLWNQDQDLEDGVDYFVFTVLEDGTVKFIDSEFNVYISEQGLFLNSKWY